VYEHDTGAIPLGAGCILCFYLHNTPAILRHEADTDAIPIGVEYSHLADTGAIPISAGC